jgi:hypothetical protein
MSRKPTSMLVAVAAVALLAAPAAARTSHSGVYHPRGNIAGTYLHPRGVAGTQVYIPANRGIPATNAFQHYDDIFVLDP